MGRYRPVATTGRPRGGRPPNTKVLPATTEEPAPCSCRAASETSIIWNSGIVEGGRPELKRCTRPQGYSDWARPPRGPRDSSSADSRRRPKAQAQSERGTRGRCRRRPGGGGGWAGCTGIAGPGRALRARMLHGAARPDRTARRIGALAKPRGPPPRRGPRSPPYGEPRRGRDRAGPPRRVQPRA